MKPSYLLDTSVLSEPVVQRPNEKVLARLRRHQEQFATASPVWHELLFGAYRLPDSRRKRDLLRYFQEVVGRTVPILPYGEEAAAWHAEERARLVSLGRTPAFVDGQIAAVAKTNDLVVVTRNVVDFSVFRGVRIEDWGR